MSQYFAEKNSENTFDLYNKRSVYKKMLFKDGNTNIVSFSDGEKIFYGRLDRSFIPINVGDRSLKQIKNVADNVTSQYAVNFVADMFDQMCLQFQKCVANGKISANDPFLSSLRAYKSYVSPKKEYTQHYKQYNDALKNMMYNRQMDKFKNFEEFIALLMGILETSIAKQPYTFAGFLKSNNCTVMSSGLAIEIADSEYMNDNEKFSTIVNSKNWKFFVNTCNTYGFMIDYNVPWRIVADIGADEVIRMANPYGPESVEQIFAFQYERSSMYGVQILKKILFELYNYIKPNFYDEIEECEDGGVIKKRVYPQTYAPNVFYEKYSDNFFTKIYLNLRMIEEQPSIQKNEREKMIEEQMQLLVSNDNNKNKKKVYTRFESIINRPFDKIGSLSYHVSADQQRQIEKFEKGHKDSTIIIDTGGSGDFSGY